MLILLEKFIRLLLLFYLLNYIFIKYVHKYYLIRRISIMDDDFGLPDEGDASVNSFVNDLFSGRTKRQTGTSGESRSAINDILASSTKQRPRVTFQNEHQPTQSERNSIPQASLLDSLFSTSKSSEQRSSVRTANTLESSLPSTHTHIRGASPSHPQNTIHNYESHSNPTTSILPSQQLQQQISSSKSIQAEIEQLKREISSLRYEHSEDQQTISELRRKLEIEQDDHKRTVDRIREENKLELQEQIRKHGRELDKMAEETDRGTQLINSIREQQGHFDSLTARFEMLNIGLGQVRDVLQNVNASTDKMAKDWHQQQSEHWKRLDEERGRFESAVRTMENEMDQMKDSYQKEIIEGRKWLEEQRNLSQTERRAFQEEQSLLSEFLRREHDLLARVLNEQFKQQRDADILRLRLICTDNKNKNPSREEAEYLEHCLNQTESAKTAMENAKSEFERRNVQLNQLREVLTRYEHLATRLVTNAQQKIMRTLLNN
ncbi:hypothetical protein Mgra_00007744 [Meloidogyne graminicola]|uniref:Uncharacterized protein n=1 Tax=Meloidogyne graminicola TaxID=189291 RepID=A0A8S9ZHV9_9BILA|nr:hypothetical protein Mgra_00007744 [Meloidogyne graminicola]